MVCKSFCKFYLLFCHAEHKGLKPFVSHSRNNAPCHCRTPTRQSIRKKIVGSSPTMTNAVMLNTHAVMLNSFQYLVYSIKTFLSSMFSSTFICWIAILFNFSRRSICAKPSFIKTAFKFSILLRQIN